MRAYVCFAIPAALVWLVVVGCGGDDSPGPGPGSDGGPVDSPPRTDGPVAGDAAGTVACGPMACGPGEYCFEQWLGGGTPGDGGVVMDDTLYVCEPIPAGCDIGDLCSCAATMACESGMSRSCVLARTVQCQCL